MHSHNLFVDNFLLTGFTVYLCSHNLMVAYKLRTEEESSLYRDALRWIFFSIVNFACDRRNNWEFSSNFFSLKITKVSKVFINNMFLGIEIYYINILFGLFDTFGANNLHMF